MRWFAIRGTHADDLKKILDYVNEKERVNTYEVALLFCDEPDIRWFAKAWVALTVLVELDMIGITENRFEFCFWKETATTEYFMSIRSKTEYAPLSHT